MRRLDSLEEIVKNSPYVSKEQIIELLVGKDQMAQKSYGRSEEAKLLYDDIGRFLYRLRNGSPPSKWTEQDEELFQFSQKKIERGSDERIAWRVDE